MSRDRTCAMLIVAVFLLTGAASNALDEKPSTASTAVFVDQVDLVKLIPVVESAGAVEAVPEPHNPTPLSDELYTVLIDACGENEVPLALALAVMEQESTFREDAVSSSGCYGLMQLNPTYFPSGLTSAENIDCGVGYLGELIGRYNSLEQAVTGYYYGPSDRASSWYSDEVLYRTAYWNKILKGEANESGQGS